MIGRWVAPLNQYHFKTVHRPRTQHRNQDGLSKRPWLRAQGQRCGDRPGSEQEIQFHVPERLREPLHRAIH